jgi:hypothetical protein
MYELQQTYKVNCRRPDQQGLLEVDGEYLLTILDYDLDEDDVFIDISSSGFHAQGIYTLAELVKVFEIID